MSTGAYISDNGDFELDENGHLRIDDSIETRCRIRISTKRGHWLNTEIGSRLHEVRLLKHSDNKIKDAIREALQPLIDSGEVVEVRLSDVVTDEPSCLSCYNRR